MKAHGYRYINIKDYKYNPGPRASFTNGKIMDIFNKAFIENRNIYEKIICDILSLALELSSIPFNKRDEIMPFWDNHWITYLDGMMIYTILAKNNPRFFVEVGSGNTTKFAYYAIKTQNLRTQIISIDPLPRTDIDTIANMCIRENLENINISFFNFLSSEDILLLDNSHRAFANSDVTVFFTEILPILPQNIIYALHDIALPHEAFTERFYNEQYMLAVYLLGGAANDTILFPVNYLANYTDLLNDKYIKLESGESLPLTSNGGFFWMKKSGDLR